MKKIIFLLLPILLLGCMDGIGPKKVKNIIELTPKLTKESNELIDAKMDLGAISIENISKLPSYRVTKNKIIAQPLAVEDVLYFTDNKGRVSAFSKTTKKILWTQDIITKDQTHYIGGGITIDHGKLYITNGSRFLFVLDVQTGHELLRKQFSDIIRVQPIVLTKNIFLIQTISNQIIAYNTTSSNTVWRHEGIAETISSSTYVNPIVRDNYLISGYSSGQLFALDANTGEEKWNINLSNSHDVSLESFDPTTLASNLITENNYLYVASSLGKIMKIDFTSGHVVWEVSAKDVQSMSLKGNSLFITNNAKQVAVINKTSGKITAVADIGLDEKGKKAVEFMSPIISKSGNDLLLNIFANNGKIYNFRIVDGHDLKELPIHNILTNLEYFGFMANGRDAYITTDSKVIFIESTNN